MPDKRSDQFRIMLHYAFKGEVDKFTAALPEIGYDGYESMLRLCIRVTGHVVIETVERYPTDDDLTAISEVAAKAVTNLPIGHTEIYACLSRVVFGKDRVTSIHEDRTKASLIPMWSLANIMLSFIPKGMTPWSWLDVIESSIEATDNLNDPVFPSVVYQFGRDHLK